MLGWTACRAGGANAVFGPVDALVNNAGGPIDPQALKGTTWPEMERHLANHLKSSVLCVQAALPGMLERQFGRIVNVTSQSAYGTRPPETAEYVLAKAALAASPRCLALQVTGQRLHLSGGRT